MNTDKTAASILAAAMYGNRPQNHENPAQAKPVMAFYYMAAVEILKNPQKATKG